MLQKTTYTFATHQIPLECDVYEDTAFPWPSSHPVLLFFHSGGLVGGARTCLPPWLAQVCYQRRWTLISASYRLLPQAGGQGLVEDATAAYKFARAWNAESSGDGRRVVVVGASGGFIMASLIAHHDKQPPVALLGITAIPTFRHPFFNTSVLLTPEPIKDEDMAPFIEGPVETGEEPEYGQTVFAPERLLENGQRNPDYAHPTKPADVTATSPSPWTRGCLYDYYVHRNKFVDLVGDVDPGFASAETDPKRLACWPPTVLIQATEDCDVSPDVGPDMASYLGTEKVDVIPAHGEGHLFEATSFLESGGTGMEAVRKAVASLEQKL